MEISVDMGRTQQALAPANVYDGTRLVDVPGRCKRGSPMWTGCVAVLEDRCPRLEVSLRYIFWD